MLWPDFLNYTLFTLKFNALKLWYKHTLTHLNITHYYVVLQSTFLFEGLN